jgi:hypothetical protein
MQMCARVRKFRSNDINVFLNGMSFKEYANFYDYDEVKTSFYEKLVSNMDFVESNDGSLVINHKEYINIAIYNHLEELNKEKFCFIPYLLNMLKDKGHSYEYDNTKYKKDKINKVNIMKEDLLKATDISKETYYHLLTKQNSDSATADEKYAIEKYLYKYYWKIDSIDEDFLNKCYRKIHVLFNYKSLQTGQVTSYNTVDETYKDLDHKLKEEKLKTIQKLLDLLGFDNVDTPTVINKDDFNKNKDSCIKKSNIFISKDTQILFKLNKKAITSMKSFLGFINTILGEYGIKVNSKSYGKNKIKSDYILIKII